MQKEAHAEKLNSDIKDVITDSKNLLEATASDLSEKSKDARKELTARFEQAKTKWEEISDGIREKVSQGADETDKLIRAKPYQSLGLALGVGLLLGAILNRR